jgi:predicted RecB family nuclease
MPKVSLAKLAPGAKSGRSNSWVSKTDLTMYLRCPYAFYLRDRGLVAFEDTINEQQARLIDEGKAFHSSVEASALPRRMELADLPKIFAEESIRLFRLPIVFKNRALEICGRPDGIDTARGALYPVEIKSHKEVQRSDELELAFYWMLLEPHRTKTTTPRGYLILRRNGVQESVEVKIRSHRFKQVDQLLQQIRDARRIGVRPRFCKCPMCSGPFRDKILAATLASKDLSLIRDIGPSHAQRLEEIGITRHDQLVDTDPVALVEKLRDRGCYVSPAQVERWKHHATSYATSAPVVFGNLPTLDGSFIALDLEYDPMQLIWLVGLCVVAPDRKFFPSQFWANTPAQEEKNLRRLTAILATNPSLPVVTWNGNIADIPRLRNAAQRLKLGQLLSVIESRHLDMLRGVVQAVRFPIPTLGLAEVARHFGMPKVSRIQDGLQANGQYQLYRSTRDKDKRDALKAELLEYNREDLTALIGVAERITALARG